MLFGEDLNRTCRKWCLLAFLLFVVRRWSRLNGVSGTGSGVSYVCIWVLLQFTHITNSFFNHYTFPTVRVILIFFKVNFFSRVELFLGGNVVFRSLFCFGSSLSLNSTFDNSPIFTNRSSSWFISSVAANGTFRFFLKLGRVFSFSSNFALILVHLPRPAENTSWKCPFSSLLIFSASVVMHSTFWPNVFIGWSQILNFWNQSDPNKFFVFFSTKIFNFLIIPFSDTAIIISPSNFILSPVTVRAVLLVIFIIGLSNFFQVCKFIIDRSEPESDWNLTNLFSTLTVMYLRTTYGPPHMAVQKQDDQHEHTFSSYVRIRGTVLKTYLGRWTIRRSGERGSGISVLPAQYDDDDDMMIVWLVLAFCLSDSIFNYFSLSTLWALISEFIAVLTFFVR